MDFHHYYNKASRKILYFFIELLKLDELGEKTILVHGFWIQKEGQEKYFWVGGLLCCKIESLLFLYFEE